jgi:hypothetical protein
MTYVADQTGAELRAHMKMLKAIPTFSDPLSDRLFKEIQMLDAELRRLHRENEDHIQQLRKEQLEVQRLHDKAKEQAKTDRFVRQLDEAIDLEATAEQMMRASADRAMIDHFLRCNLNSDADYAEYSEALDRLYTTPPAAQRQWVGLTEEEHTQIVVEASGWNNPTSGFFSVARFIEAKLKEKNND